MRLILQDAARWPGHFASSQWQAWKASTTTPADGLMLGPVRLVLGLLATWSWINLGLELSDWLGPDGWLPRDAAIAYRQATIPWGWSLWDYVPASANGLVYVLGLIIFLAWAAGAFCRITGPLAWIFFHSTVRRLPVMLFGFDAVMGTFILYLAVTGTGGESLSVDRWRARRRGDKTLTEQSLRSTVAIRLIQLQLCLIYGAAGLAKLMGEPWWTGTAAYFLVANSEFRGVSILESLGRSRSMTALATHIPLWTEIVQPVLIWPKLWRPLILVLTIGMHLTIALTLGLWEFSLAMIAANLVFIDGGWVRARLAGTGHSNGQGLE